MKSALAPSALLLALLAPFAAMSQISVAINIRPPELPVYVQPPVPGDGYLWTPGYWGWSNGDNDYYWIPGTWVQPPTVGVLWTPGYWGFHSGGYRWRAGYWGPQVGFYGGIAYGHGYTGRGYHGGRWDRGAFHYNTSVNNVDKVVVRNVYKTTVVNNYNVKRVSFNGGPDGVKDQPTAKERNEQKVKHVDPTPNQLQHERTAMATPTQKASVNRGNPPVGATAKPSQLDGPGKTRGDDETPAALKKSNGDDASPAQMKAGAERQQAQAAEPTQGKREQKADKAQANTTTTPPDGAQPAQPDNNAAKRAQRADAQMPQDAHDGRAEQARPKSEPRSQKQVEPQPQSPQEPQRQQPQSKQQQQQSRPQQQEQASQQQQAKAQGEGSKDKARD